MEKVIRRLVEWAANEAAKERLDEIPRTMSDDEWNDYMGGFCTLTPEGQAAKDYLLAARDKASDDRVPPSPRSAEGGQG